MANEPDEFLISEEIAARVRAASARKAGKARLTSMTAEERTRIAKLAAQARWGKKTIAPEPNPTDPHGGPERDRQGAESGIMLTSGRKRAIPVSVTSQLGGPRAAA